MDLQIKEVLSKRIALRDKLHVLKTKFEEEANKIKAVEQKCEAWLLARAREAGVTQFKVDGIGTAYISVKTKVSCGDWVAFYDWIIETSSVDALERRVSSTFVKEYRAEHKELPPGVNTFDEQVINVRRDSKPTGDTA